MDVSKIRSIADLDQAIREEAGLGLNEVPMTVKTRWGQSTILEVGQPIPPGAEGSGLQGYGHLKVLAMFYDDTELRVYTVHVEAAEEGKKLDPPHLFSFTRSGPSYAVSQLTIGMLVMEIAEEIQLLANGDEDDEDDEDDDDEKDAPESGSPVQENKVSPPDDVVEAPAS